MIFNEEQLKEYGSDLGAKLGPGDVVALTGELGAGKTTLAKAIAEGLGVTEAVTSPTFVLACEYKTGRLPFYHIDLYRLESIGEMDDIGLDEYLYGSGITVVEWADRALDLLPKNTLLIGLSHTDDPYLRLLEVRADVCD